MSDDKALTVIDLQIAESKTTAWLYGATCVAALLCLIPGMPAISAVMIPAVAASIRGAVISRRQLRESRRRRASEEGATR